MTTPLPLTPKQQQLLEHALGRFTNPPQFEWVGTRQYSRPILDLTAAITMTVTASANDSSDAFKTLCSYARNYIEERGDKEEVDNLERVIASLSRRLALDADPTNGALGVTYTIPGLAWPETLGDWTLMGPANRLGSWRWYQLRTEIDGAQITQRIKLDSQLQPIWESLRTIQDA